MDQASPIRYRVIINQAQETTTVYTIEEATVKSEIINRPKSPVFTNELENFTRNSEKTGEVVMVETEHRSRKKNYPHTQFMTHFQLKERK